MLVIDDFKIKGRLLPTISPKKELRKDGFAGSQHRRACTCKRRFHDPEQAKVAIRRCFRPVELTFYECKYCNGFHLTRNLAMNLSPVVTQPSSSTEAEGA